MRLSAPAALSGGPVRPDPEVLQGHRAVGAGGLSISRWFCRIQKKFMHAKERSGAHEGNISLNSHGTKPSVNRDREITP